MPATLLPAEITAIHAALAAGHRIGRMALPSGSRVAVDLDAGRGDNPHLFATGSAESFAHLWAQFEDLKGKR